MHPGVLALSFLTERQHSVFLSRFFRVKAFPPDGLLRPADTAMRCSCVPVVLVALAAHAHVPATAMRMMHRPVVAQRAHAYRSAPVRCVTAATLDSNGPRIVLIDEQERMRNAVQQYLSQHGYRCACFATGSEAMQALARSPLPDAIVTEVPMGGSMDGLGLLRAVRSDARLCAVPVVLLTSRGLTSDRVAGYSAGASAYITKPYDPQELVAVLQSITTNSRLARSAIVNDELREMRAEMASMRQLLQAVLVQGSGGSLQGYTPVTPPPDASGGAPLQLPAEAVSQKPPVELPKLTRRERSVLELVGDGKLNKEISAELGVGLRYVEKVVRRLLEKTGTPNRTALVRRALQLGLLTDEPTAYAADQQVFVVQYVPAAQLQQYRQGAPPVPSPPSVPFGKLPRGRPKKEAAEEQSADRHGERRLPAGQLRNQAALKAERHLDKDGSAS
jgi:DNA-binding NarL/FixJ family response regulator